MATPQKPVKDWSFDDLLDWAGWRIASGLIKGRDLRSLVYDVCMTTQAWHREVVLPKLEADKRALSKKRRTHGKARRT